MDQGTVIEIAQRALAVMVYLAAPILGLSLIVGIAVSVFQATTQIQEQTLTFVPKIIAVIAAICLFGQWMLRIMVEYIQDLFSHINEFIR